jgi:hypothetical protein
MVQLFSETFRTGQSDLVAPNGKLEPFGKRFSGPWRDRMKQLIAIIFLLAVSGCSSIMTHTFAEDVSQGILNQDDLETVRAGAPAYLLLIDGMISGNPNDVALLMAGARLYSSYATIFVDDNERAQIMAGKAYRYGARALCIHRPDSCLIANRPFQQFLDFISTTTTDDLNPLYVYATAWAASINARKGKWDALADLPKVETVLERIVDLADDFERGRAHMYLGVLHTLRPPAMGGRPDIGRAHFERALEISGGRNLMARVELARRYARMVFDRTLHDDQLRQVLKADPIEPGFTLSNALAHRQARRLLKSSSEYFGE